MRYFQILICALLVPVTIEAQPSGCPALPTKPTVPVASTTKSPSQIAMAAVSKSADMAVKKLQFEQQMAKLDADPNVQAQRNKHLQMLSAAANGPDIQKKKLEMTNQIAAAQSSNSFQNQKAKFQADLKCTGQ